MSAQIKTLMDLNDNPVYPQTHVNAVYDSEGKQLGTSLDEINTEIEIMKSSFSVVLSASNWVTVADNENIPAYDDYIYAYYAVVPNMLAKYNPKLFTNYISTTQSGKIAEERALSLIKDIITYDDHIIVYAYQVPAVDVNITLAL